MKTDFTYRFEYGFRFFGILSHDRRRDDCNNLLPFFYFRENIEYFRYFENRSERTSVDTFAAIDTFRFIDMFDAVLVFRNGFYRTGFFTRYWNIYDGMIRTGFFANSATDAFAVIDSGLAIFSERDCFSRTIHVTSSCFTSSAEIGYFVIYLNACGAGFINDT